MMYIYATMVRTQIYLPKRERDFIKREAARKNTTMAELVRMLVKEYAARALPPAAKTNAGDFLLGLSDLARAGGYRGPKNLARDTDKYLYGK